MAVAGSYDYLAQERIVYGRPAAEVAVNGERQALVAAAMGRPGERAADVVGELIAALGLPRALPEVGVGADLYPAIAERALGNMWVRTNPRPIESAADVIEILEMATA